MMRYLSFKEVIALHAEVIFRSGGILGIRYEIESFVNEQEQVIIAVASGRMSRSELGEWLAQNIVATSGRE